MLHLTFCLMEKHSNFDTTATATACNINKENTRLNTLHIFNLYQFSLRFVFLLFRLPTQVYIQAHIDTNNLSTLSV